MVNLVIMVLSRKISIIDKVEATKDSFGWIVFFGGNKYQQRIPSKYCVEPRPGDSIELYGFPYTHGIKINDKVVFMLGKKESKIHFNDLSINQKKVKRLEKILSETQNRKVKA
jgi:hypothetical protein